MPNIPKLADGKIDFTEWYYSDPQAATAYQIAENNKALTQQYTQQVGQSRFWDKFFSAHRELEPDTALVTEVLNANMTELGTMTDIPAAIERLAELTHAHIAKDMKRRARNAEYGVMRGGPGTDSNAVNVAPDDGDFTMSETIKRRREMRRNAQAGLEANREYGKGT